MKLSTMTNLYYKDTCDNEGFNRSLRKTHSAGFDAIDMCLCPLQRNETELSREGWEKVLEKLVETKNELDLDIYQSHLPYPKSALRRKYNTDDGCEMNEHFRMMTERSIRISAALGVKWAVVHPVEYENVWSLEGIKYNQKIYEPIIKLASSLGVGIAFENMPDNLELRRFGVTGNELSELAKSFGDKSVGVCWDFGHANRVFKNQTEQLKKIGKYLHATHVDDNVGSKDDLHTLPFFGNTDWNTVMPLLKEIGYDECFNYELSIARHIPEDLLDQTVQYAYLIGRKLLEMAN